LPRAAECTHPQGEHLVVIRAADSATNVGVAKVILK